MMKNYIWLLSIPLLIISGCGREEALPELGVEGVYLMVRIENSEILEEEDLPYENVYWFFADRTFQKVRLTDGELKEASGIFSPVTDPSDEAAEGQAYELIFTLGEELIEGCYTDREIIVQTTETELVHAGSTCGAPDIYYIKANFN